MPLLVDIPDDLASAMRRHPAVMADEKPVRKRRQKTRDEWRKFVAKKFGPSAIEGALSRAASTRKHLSDTDRERRQRIKAAASLAEIDPRDEMTVDPLSGIRVAKYGTDKGTEPTRKRVQADPLASMLSRDQITQEQHDAATRILAAYQIITQGMDARISTYGQSIGGGRDDYESVYAITIQENYLDWVDEMAVRAVANSKAKRGGSRWKTSIVMDIIVEGRTCSQIANDRGMCKSSVADLFRDALDLYNDVRNGRLRAKESRAA